MRSHLDKNRAISLLCQQRRTIRLSRGFFTSCYSVNARPCRAITLLHGTGRTLTICDLTDGEHRFASWFETMASSRAPNSAAHWTRVKQRGSCETPEGSTVSLTRGVFGGDRRARIETEGEPSNPGEFPKTLTPSASVHRYHPCT